MKITLLLVALTSILHAQGSLDPPAGPAPAMKPLDQIEPRAPISSLSDTIAKSGSSYLAGNLQFSSASGKGITIMGSDVSHRFDGLYPVLLIFSNG